MSDEIKGLINIINLQAETISAFKTISVLHQRIESLESTVKTLISLINDKKENTDNKTTTSI